MKTVLNSTLNTLIWIIGKKNLEKALIYILKILDANLYLHGLIQIGAGGNHYIETNGEKNFIENILPDMLQQFTLPIIFDIGANKGEFSILLREKFNKAKVSAFEPVEETYQTLTANTQNYSIDCFNIGFGETIGQATLYNSSDNSNSEIASMSKEAFMNVFNPEGGIKEINFSMTTLDVFCKLNDIKYIHFLKIDVEGHELAVLKGAHELIKTNTIGIIQFEFNEHNIYSRIFLRDFYQILPNYILYRITPKGIVEIGEYTPKCEIFSFQNIVAVHKSLNFSC